VKGITGLLKFFLILILLLILFSCTGKGTIPADGKFEYAKDFSKGPISLLMRVDKTVITTAGKLQVLLEAKAEDGWRIYFPPPPESPGKFTLGEIIDTNPRLNEDGSTVVSRTIMLKPFLSGDYEIPALSLNYSKGEDKGVLLTSPVEAKVTTDIGRGLKVDLLIVCHFYFIVELWDIPSSHMNR
jgi:hypothetical protein